MPRTARRNQIIPGCLVHLISRFVDGRFLFDDAARHEYLRLLGLALRQTDWRIVAYALMSSHIHLALISGRQFLDPWIHWVHTGISQWLNERRRASDAQTRGHVFADRPKTKVYPLMVGPNVIIYQHQNPRSAGVVEDPSESTWTSHRAYAGLDATPVWLDVTLGLGLCGYRDDDAGRRAFHEAVCARRIGRDDLERLPQIVSAEDVTGPLVRLVDGMDEAEIVQWAAVRWGVSPAEVRSRSRVRAVVAARKVALHAWRALGGRTARMAQYLGLSSSAASQLTRCVTGLEEDVAFVLGRVQGRQQAA
jgi:REP element-mobilizing transposase RayT